jgi:broad specificity phosphatase PhoE
MTVQRTAFFEVNPIAVQTVVYLARHGTPDWNIRDIRYDVPPGPPLVPQGEKEAEQLGAFLLQADVRKFYSSPLVRAQQTAEIAASVVGAPIEVAVAAAEYRREENDEIVFARFYQLFEQAWAEATTGGPVVIVSHGGPVRVILEKIGVLSDHIWHYRRQFDHQNPLPPAGAWEITQSMNTGEWQARLAFSPQAYTEYLPAIVYV